VKSHAIGVLVCFGALLLFQNESNAQDVDPAYEADVVRLLEVTEAAKMAEQIAAQVTTAMFNGLRQASPNVPARAFEVIQEVVQGTIVSGYSAPDGPLASVPAVYLRHLTHAEIQGLLEFYETDLGRKVIQVMPSITQELGAIGEEWATGLFPEVQAEVERRFREEGFLD
jgi:hypothetical protein